MNLFWIPFFLTLTVCISTFLFKKVKGHNIHWNENTDDKITVIVVGIIVFWAGLFIFLDPNNLQGTASGVGNLYTSGRQMGIILMGMSVGATYKTLYTITHEQKQKEGLIFEKLVYMMFMLSASISGAFGFLTRTCWGLFEIKYISDTFMWWVELFWCIAGLVGIWTYFKYIRYWNGKDLFNK